MSIVTIAPAAVDIFDAITLHHDFDCEYPEDAEVSLKQGDEILEFHPDRIPDLMVALADLAMAWKRHNSPLYRDPATTTKGDA